MTITLKQVRAGSVVIVRGSFGNGRPVQATVVEVERDIKNGYPGIDYEVHGEEDGSWAYLTQIDRVVKY